MVNLIEESSVAFANRNFTHEVKTTGRLHQSEWALMCKVENEEIVEYKFYEDSLKYHEANI